MRTTLATTITLAALGFGALFAAAAPAIATPAWCIAWKASPRMPCPRP